MNATVSYCLGICLTAVVVAVAVCAPGVLSDRNPFLLNFVNHEFLNVMGVVIAISVASAAQLHLTLNTLEERINEEGAFRRTRTQLHRSIYWLITLFALSVLLVVVKPFVALQEWSQALVNGTALILLACYLLALVSQVQAIFSLRPLTGGE